MKKSADGDFKAIVYRGQCESCAEAYEAKSQTEDLEGITFKCRKVMCTGRVSLSCKNLPSLKKASDAQVSAVPAQDLKGAPRRYC